MCCESHHIIINCDVYDDAGEGNYDVNGHICAGGLCAMREGG